MLQQIPFPLSFVESARLTLLFATQTKTELKLNASWQLQITHANLLESLMIW